MDLPFSGLPAATVANAADLVCVSQGGVSKKTTRSILFVAQAGDDIGLSRSVGLGQFTLSAAGAVTMEASAGATARVSGGGTTVDVTPAGNVVVTLFGGAAVQIGTGPDTISFDTTTHHMTLQSQAVMGFLGGAGNAVLTLPASGNATLTYTDVSGSWNPNPTDLLVAVTRLAAAVAGLLAGPIP